MATVDIPAVVPAEVPAGGPVARREATVMEIASVIAGSRDFPECRTPEKAAVRILAGREMGVGPVAAVLGIRVKDGRVSMDAALMAGCIKRSGIYDYRVVNHDDQSCTTEFSEAGQVVGQSTFTMDDARKAGLDKKSTWKEYPRNMLFARAMSNGARWYCPAIFGGSIYTHEELGLAVDAEGRALESEGSSTNGDLCTRDQRQQIAKLVEAAGDSMVGFLADAGVRLLDEFSQFEADQAIKKLEKRLAKKSNGTAPAIEPTPAVKPATVEPLTPAQQMISDAMVESGQPSTVEQRNSILTMAIQIVPDETECREMLLAALARRSCRKLADLNYLQAAALIEALQAKLADDPPFDPTPAAQPGTETPLPERARGTKPK